jgi:2'-5' RNA ligase
MPDSFNGAARVNCFALVTYVPDPLGRFLDELRVSIEPRSLAPRAHVTILPPRVLTEGVSPEEVWREIETELRRWDGFPIRIGTPEVFPATNVVYLAINGGWDRLQQLHLRLNRGAAMFAEPFPYHPHITLAQGLDEAEAKRVRDAAEVAWNQYSGKPEFAAEAFTFVQALDDNRWVDLAEIRLEPVATLRRD